MEADLNKFLSHCKYEKNLSDKTIKAYTIDLDQFRTYMSNVLGVTEIKQIRKDELKSYIQSISAFKPKTIKRKIASLKAMFNFFEFEEHIEYSPFRKVRFKIKEPMVLPTVMSMDEVSKMFGAVYGELGNFPKETYLYKEKVRDVAVVELLFGTGVRVFELCSLTKDIVDSRFSFIKVYGKGGKERTVQIENEEIKRALKNYYLLFKGEIEKGEFFFVNRMGRRLSEQSVRLMIRKYRLNCMITKNITPHIFRHSFATLLLEKDVDIKYIQTILGHSSIVTTQLYTHVSSEKQTAILHDKHPRNEMNFG